MRLFLRLALPASLGTGAFFLALSACSDDGDTSFGPNVDLPVYDSGTDVADAGVDEITDGSTDGPKPGCTTGTVAILSGQGGLLNASVDRGRGFAVANITGTAADSTPALLAYGDGFVGVMRAGPNLMWTAYKGSWSPPAILANLSNPDGTSPVPTLTTNGPLAFVVYPSGNDRHFYKAEYNGNGWGAGVSVESGPGAYSFGTDGAGFAWTGQDFAWAENGTNMGLYTRALTSTWSPGAAVDGAGTKGVAAAVPQVIAIEGATYDAIGLFVGGANDQTDRLGWVRRKKSDKTWSAGRPPSPAPATPLLDTTHTTTERMNVARTAGGDVIVTYRATDGNGYYVRGALNDAAGVTWSAPASLGGEATLKVDSPPAVAKGVCGSDALAVFASDGKVQITRLKDGAWSAAEQITGASGYLVAIATRGQ